MASDCYTMKRRKGNCYFAGTAEKNRGAGEEDVVRFVCSSAVGRFAQMDASHAGTKTVNSPLS